MAYFKYVVERCYDPNFDLYSLPPRTPQDKMIVSMREFHLKDLLNCVIYNITNQRQQLKQETISNLIEFLTDDFADVTKKTFLQVLVHFSKMNIELLYGRYTSYCAMNNLPNELIKSEMEYYDGEISSFILKASQGYTGSEVVSPIAQEDEDAIRNFLSRTPVLSALYSSMTHLLGPIDPHDLDIGLELLKMKIYAVEKFSPMEGLRGCSLVDGILLCQGRLAGSKGSSNNIADLFTVAIHESCHYLARVKTNNLNFSSPYNFSTHNEPVRLDPLSPRLPLEMGRYVELLLFGGVQPNWAKSKLSAAEAFMERVKNQSSYPIIPKTDHKLLGLEGRVFPSPPFGIDIEEEDIFC